MITNIKSLIVFAVFIFIISMSGANAQPQSKPIATFSISDTIGCSPMQVSFKNKSINAAYYKWNLGNGNTSTLQDPSNVYMAPGRYTVTLIAISAGGATDTFVSDLAIRVVANPASAFKAAQLTACQGTEIAFTNNSLNSSNWIWDFGDGYSSTLNNPSHKYMQPGVYTVKLIAQNAYGCKDVAVKQGYITIYANPKASFQSSITSTCDSNAVISFISNSANVTSWLWKFGDGTVSTNATPSHSYKHSGNYTVSLKVTNANGCQDSFIRPSYIHIIKLVKPSFTANSQNGCINSTSVFKINAPGAKTYLWDFGDGSSDTVANPAHIYAYEGNYTVSVTVFYPGGCQLSTSYTNFILVKGTLKAGFSGSGKGCAPVNVNFTDKSTNGVTWFWDFGDSSSSTSRNPKHNYSKPGNYTVTQHVYGINGCEAIYSVKNAVVINPYAKPIFSASKTKGCPPLTVVFQNSTTNGASYVWDFGDGSKSSAVTPTHIFTKQGTFKVTLTSKNADGCIDTSIAKTTITVKDPTPIYKAPATIIACLPFTTSFSDATTSAVSWSWDFGDGTTSTDKYPTHTYNAIGDYTVSLSVITTNGCHMSFPVFQKISIIKTKADFSFTTNQCPPYYAYCSDSSSGATQWYWDFGDGTTSPEKNPVHSFTGSGTYTISLTIGTAGGCTQRTSKSVYFTPFQASAGPGLVPFVFPAKVSFYSNAINATRYHWDFGDKDTSDLANPTHTYQDSDHYVIHLTIWNSKGCKLSYTLEPFPRKKPITPPVDNNNNGSAVLKAGFISSSAKGCAPLIVNFRNSSNLANAVYWDFGDGTTSTALNPNHIYKTQGKYTVTLIAADATGNKDTLKMVDYIDARISQSVFNLHQYTSEKKATVNFIDSSINPVSWNWNFGDGSSSTLQNPVHIYPNDSPRFYPVTLTVTNDAGCINSSSKIVYNGYDYPLNISAYGLCFEDSLRLSSNFKSFTQYTWDFGDSTVSHSQQPNHKYAKAGSYAVALTIKNEQSNHFTYMATDSVVVYHPLASFTSIGPKEACDSATLSFKNTSIGATAYVWDFGDGDTSSKANPVHIFNKPGAFTVKLTAKIKDCDNVFTATNLITIHQAKPYYSMNQSNVCFPTTCTFADRSDNPVSWLWDFGDGSTSTDQSPSHTYAAMPANRPFLSIIDKNGCKGSYVGPPIVKLTANLGVDNPKGCAPLICKFQDQSSYASSYKWEFGDGTVSTERNPVHIYRNNGVYDVKLTVSSESGCVDSIHNKAFIKASKPKGNFFSPEAASCAPSYVTFKDQSVNASSWYWDFGDSAYSQNNNPSHIYNLPGYYTVKVIVYNDGGCTDTFIRQNYVHVLGPVSAFNASKNKGCPDTKIEFTDKSKDAVSWSWNFGDGDTSNLISPSHIYHNPGSYTVTLITHDKTGCSSATTLKPSITIYDRIPPVVSPVKRVTVASNESVTIDWVQNNDNDFQSYRIFRKEAQESNYQLAAEITDQAIVSFEDNGIDPLHHAYTYKIQTVDQCGYAVPLDSLIAHTTINVSAKTSGANIKVSWNPYGGYAVSSYQVYREESNNQPLLIATLGADMSSYLDTGTYCPVPYSYRIVATGLWHNTLLSYSDTAIASPINHFANQKVDVVRTTVLNYTYTLTEWKAPQYKPESVVAYTVYRSDNNKSFSAIATVNSHYNSYIDSSADVQKQQYFYRVEPVNSCQASVAKGLPGSSIYLQAEVYDESSVLNWTNYQGWEKGIAYYVIEKLEENGNWKIVTKVSGNTNTYQDH